MWQRTEEKLLGRAALKHKLTKEKTIFGQYGMIWEYDMDNISVLVTSAKPAHRIEKLLGYKKSFLRDKCEVIFKVPAYIIDDVCRIIYAPKSPGAQLRYATRWS